MSAPGDELSSSALMSDAAAAKMIKNWSSAIKISRIEPYELPNRALSELPQSDIDAKSRAVDVHPIIGDFRLR
jgi:hypothetical protein